MTAFRTRRGIAAATAVLAGWTLAGCSSSKHHAASAGVSSPPEAAATRWWSNSAVTVGSPIDSAHPGSAAARLSPSRQDYCGMLKQTLDSRKSLLPSGSPTTPQLTVATQAFVAEIAKVAPSSVAAPWQRLAPVILGMVKSGGQWPSGSSAVSAQNLQAAEAINVDAKKNCGVDLSSVATG